MTEITLFDPVSLGRLRLPNRINMAPMTRARTDQPGDIPSEMMAHYYSQRATAGLIISEATQISPQGKGYSFTPGIHSEGHIAGWKKVTDAVHVAGGRIFCQLWHVGRMSHASFHKDGETVAPSAIAPQAQVWISDGTGAGAMVDSPVPRALAEKEISAIIDDYRRAAVHALEAGFDGVEIHGANGYLIDQFLRSSANQRTDQYGGSPENRIRFAREVTQAVSREIGPDRVGIRLSPYISLRGMDDPLAPDTILLAVQSFQEQGLAYIHLVEAEWENSPPIPLEFRKKLRAGFSGHIMVAGGYDLTKANWIIEEGLADSVAFGRLFIANPDLPARFRKDASMNEPADPITFFGGGHEGYTDYPMLSD